MGPSEHWNRNNWTNIKLGYTIQKYKHSETDKGQGITYCAHLYAQHDPGLGNEESETDSVRNKTKQKNKVLPRINKFTTQNWI